MIRKKTTDPRSAVATDLELGQRIRTRRVELRVSQQELAALLGVSFQQIHNYEKGANRVDANRLAVIAAALKMRLEELYKPDHALPDVSSLIDVDDKSTQRMLRAYSRIKDQATRRKMVELVETIASAAMD